MSTLGLTARRELQQAWRDGRARLSLLAVLVLFMITLLVGWQQQSRHESEVLQAASADRRIWEQQGARNPHSVAHFGQYAFKSEGALSLFDPGLTPWLGSALWMEAHYQNTASFRPAEDRSAPALVATLSPAYVLLYLAPLLLVFVGHALVSHERERQTLKLALANGARLSAWIGGKFLALGALAGLLWLPAWLAVVFADTDDARARALALLAIYGVYLLTTCALIIAVSARAATARGALLALLCSWVLMALLVPRVAAAIAEQVAPSADAGEFWREVRAALRQGIDGHDSADAREQALLRKTLGQYGVTREEDLPISFAGFALQASEEHGNEVFDHFYGRLREGERHQRTVLRLATIASPWVSVRALSAGLAGTDADHHWHYVREAERYRRELQRFLNDDMTRHGKGRDFEYAAQPALWRETPVFTYSPPPLRAVSLGYLPDVLLLLGWLVVAVAAMFLAARRLTREGAVS